MGWENNEIPLGVSVNFYFDPSDYKDKDYNQIVEVIQRGNTAVTIGTRKGTVGQGHAMSVVGVDSEGRLIVNESNNSEEFAKKIAGNGNYSSYVDENGEIRYEMYLSQERFSDVIFSIGSYRTK